MKNIVLLVLCLMVASAVPAQLNMTYKSHVEYDEDLNDIWGYAAPDGREYAIVGLREGVSIIDVTDTENPVIKGNAPGPSSTWRDIKTFGTYAYITNENSDGLLVIDLSNLPSDLTEDDYFYWAPSLPGLGTLSSCHNIYIDEVGYAYLVGCNLNSGGMLYIDVFTTPGSPEYVAAGPSVYSHDIYVRDNLAYNSEINDGVFSVYDVSDKFNTIDLGDQSTPFDFTHNAWLSDDSNIIFTTDERQNAPVAAYDISDLNNIQELDQFVPLQTLGEGVIPHNVHVWNDWLIISYYTDGCIIVDGSNPDNMIEVGNFDTFIPAGTGFSGAWGAYPFLPSGTVLVSDIENGCYILEPNYVRACWLEGNVTDLATNADIQGVTVEIETAELNQGSTGFDGNYKTGLAISGNYNVTFSHPLYLPLTTTATLENGVLTTLDVQLGALPTQVVNGQVLDINTGNPIPNAEVFIQSDIVNYNETADANGNFSATSVIEGNYTIYAGSWGYINDSITSTVMGAPANFVIELDKGYADDFIVDLDWDIQNIGNALTGAWERGEPIGTFNNNGTTFNPEFDVTGDVGNFCYVTGNDGGSWFADDVDNGLTRLTSPAMDLSNYNEPVMRCSYWFVNAGGGGNADDFLVISVNNGTESIVLDTISDSDNGWNSFEVSLNDFLISSNNTTIVFETSDQVVSNFGHVLEVGIDAFEVFDASPTATFEIDQNKVELNAFPNPFDQELTVQYEFESRPQEASIHIFNLLGQEIESIIVNDTRGNIRVQSIQQSGIYFIQLKVDGENTEAIKVVKN